jgi:iron complex outermembrane receptor protein
MSMFVHLRRALSYSATLCLLGSITPAMAQTTNFNLLSQPAVNAIPMFARQAGIQIVAPAGKLDGINTQAIHGEMDRRQALAKLLEGTHLVVSSDDGKVVILQLAEPPKPVAPIKSKPEALNTAVEERALEEVVVSGYVESLVQARAIKRSSVGNEEVIVAEDIAAFPDLNLAESLQRVPGVTINRDSGEGRQITLRGLGPDFTRTQLNGMEVLGNTASGMDNRGGVSRTRSFDYSLFASE